MAYLTYNDLSSRQAFSKAQTLNESINARSVNAMKVFLSYRHKDRSLIDGVVRFLTGLGVTVYIDYLDQTLEEQTNETVAKLLRDRINGCAKFISLASVNSGDSKWMPWELGLGDRIINYPNVAVLPLTHAADHWPDQEYGKIYGRIENLPSVGFPRQDTWYVRYPDGKKIEFKKWLLN